MSLISKVLLILSISYFSLNAKSFRIDATDLIFNLNNYTILDARPLKQYNKLHIRNALSFPVNLTFDNLKEDGKITGAKKIQKIIRKLGLDKNDQVVIYDDGSFFDASRLFWTLEVYGFKNVKLINLSYKAWVQKSYPTSKKVKSVKASKYIASVDNKRLATKFATQIASKNPNQIIVDARPANGYNGIESVASRYGHIPSAINLPASDNIHKKSDNQSVLHEIETLEALYSELPKNKKIIIYCAVGKISSSNYFALRELGYNVANYDASWKQWGNEHSLPIVNPSDNY